MSSSFSFSKMRSAVSNVSSGIKDKVKGSAETHLHMHDSGECSHGLHDSEHRYDSFSPQRDGNDIKWYVDGAGYFWAVSVAIENAKESIWILDWWLSPELYCRRPPATHQKFRLDRLLKRAAERGVKVHIIVYKEVTQALTLSSAHTKHHLEGMHKNIAVFRHPDHTPDVKTLSSDFMDSIKNIKMNAKALAKLPGDAMQGIYGVTGAGTVLYWAHHEKLCLIDGEIAFMGGLDLCYGRWDTNQHSIADVHPTNLDEIVFPGQDYNNARVMDFQEVDKWKGNKLDRQKSSRMGWSDVSLCLRGPTVEDLKRHFAQRWNFIYDDKYDTRSDERYQRLKLPGVGEVGHHHLGKIGEAIEERREDAVDRLQEGRERFDQARGKTHQGAVPCQIVRSACDWSHGGSLEHSIANAYIDVIGKSERFIYIENQFFITATSSKQEPVFNRIGGALVERILRAARAGEKYKVIVVIPAVPAFAGDLRADAALGTRAIMEFQYNGICRGKGESIMECIQREGFDPKDYIRFYNLRNYDRIQSGGKMKKAEEESGVSYEQARKHHDDKMGAGYEGEGEGTGATEDQTGASDHFKGARKHHDDSWDSVASCYMLGGEDIRKVPWVEGDVKEIDAFVSEELYVHTKLLIADDRVVICGSANLNDRSQLGSHDSEIAIVVEDPSPCESSMDSKPWTASKFAASLRREITRKHLGLVAPQDYTTPDANFKPIDVAGNKYDWGSEEDKMVADPLSDAFQKLWSQTAKTNTDAFERIFHPVPSDKVKNWKEYDEYYEKFFGTELDKDAKTSKYEWGHVVSEEFKDVNEVKEVLSTIKGTLVEMPLHFLEQEDIAQEGLGLNSFTEAVYT